MTEQNGPLVILLVEDNPGDVFMVREALEDAGEDSELHVASTGLEALEFLAPSDAKAQPLRPDLMILDLNLPAMPGRDVMAHMQATPGMKHLPVAVLSTSRNEHTVCQEFPGLRSTFAVKTPDYEELVEIVRRFVRFARGAVT